MAHVPLTAVRYRTPVLECFLAFYRLVVLKRLRGLKTRIIEQLDFNSLIFLAKENQPPPQHHLFPRIISSSASPISQDHLLLSITSVL
jgi:hypothetical protein